MPSTPNDLEYWGLELENPDDADKFRRLANPKTLEDFGLVVRVKCPEPNLEILECLINASNSVEEIARKAFRDWRYDGLGCA
jgi:hypothetical protein